MFYNKSDFQRANWGNLRRVSMKFYICISRTLTGESSDLHPCP